MKITALKPQLKDQNRASIFVDGSYSFSLTLSQVLEQKITIGQTLSEQQLAKLKKLSEQGKQYARALDWLMRRPHSTKEFRDYMYRKKAEPELTDAFVQKLTARGSLDDHYFAQWWADARYAKNKSWRSIASELKQKGVDTAIITELTPQAQTAGQEVNSDKVPLGNLMQKLKARPRYNDQNKLIRYLLGKGFNYGDIKEALSIEPQED